MTMKTATKRQTEHDALIKSAEDFLSTHRGTSSSLAEEYGKLLKAYKKLNRQFSQVVSISDKYQSQVKEKEVQLDGALTQLKQLRDILLPICMYCKKIRTDNNYWERIETYFSKHIEVMFSHGICPDCVKERFGEGPERARRLQEMINKLGLPASKRKIQSAVPTEDATLSAMKTLLKDTSLSGSPLYVHLGKFADKYGKLLTRLNKILIISDSYQAQLQELNLRLDSLARTDILTGLANRRDMIEILEKERSRAERQGGSFSLIMADIDHFKDINDRYGHETGDQCLKKIAHTLKTNLRKEDICSRWGGEEFLILLPATDLMMAVATGRKLIEQIERLDVGGQETPVKLTVSAGVSVFHQNRNIDECISLADQAMYAAKAAGRNRISFLP